MPRFEIAHIKEHDVEGLAVDLIIIPLEASFGQKPARDQQDVINELQMRARAAGLAGTVCPVWRGASGEMSFIAPTGWHPYFASLNLEIVRAALNRWIAW